MSNESSQNLFPKIGEVVEKEAAKPDEVQAQVVKVQLDEDNPVQEIESLCMQCEQQVSEGTLWDR